MVESVLTSKSVSQWKFEDKFEDKTATSLLQFKWNRGCFSHGPYKNIGTWSVWTVFHCFPFGLEKLWLYFALNSSLPGPWEAAELLDKRLELHFLHSQIPMDPQCWNGPSTNSCSCQERGAQENISPYQADLQLWGLREVILKYPNVSFWLKRWSKQSLTSPISEVKRNSALYSDLECKYFHVWIFFWPRNFQLNSTSIIAWQKSPVPLILLFVAVKC